MTDNIEQLRPEEPRIGIFSRDNKRTRIRLSDSFVKPAPLDFVFCGVIAGSVASVVAPGSTGKGFFTLGVCFDLLTGKNQLGLNIQKLSKDQKIAFITAEDTQQIITHRLHSLIHHYKMSADDTFILDEQVQFISTQGELSWDLVNKSLELNHALINLLIEQFKDYRLIFIDTLVRMHTANENENSNMRVVIDVFEHIAKKTGAAIVFTHHTSKSAIRNGSGGDADSARGAAAITDNLRCQINLSKITEEDAQRINVPENLRHRYVWLHDSKVNYQDTSSATLLTRVEGGVLVFSKHPDEVKMETSKCQFQKG